MISSSATYRDVQQELITEIHRNSFWPVVVSVDGKISRTEKLDYIDRDGSNVILTLDGNIKSITAEILGLILDRMKEFTRLWNSEIRFVVAGANEFSTSQLKIIFDYLSKLRIYNYIFVSQEHDVLDKEYSRPTKDYELGTGIKFGVYTWFPYQSSYRCTEVNDITLLDSWVISVQGHLTKKTDLFPGKISKSLSGCPMKAVVRDIRDIYTTYYYNDTDSNGSIVTKVSGYEMDLLTMVLKQMNMTFVLFSTPESFEIEKALTDNLITAMF